ncbi:MAG TPA: hypothetical protein VGM27_14020 [Acidobacteriaceae bacterium]
MSLAAIGISASAPPMPVEQHSTPSVAPTGSAPAAFAPAATVSISAAGHKAAASGDVDHDGDGH